MSTADNHVQIAIPRETHTLLKALAEKECRSMPKQIAFLVKQEAAKQAA